MLSFTDNLILVIDLILNKLPESLRYKVRNALLKRDDFSIISDNCWGGFVYQHFQLRYKTPFVGLFIFSPDYMKLIENVKHYMEVELVFIEPKLSKYREQLDLSSGVYPIARLNDVEIHFLHYKDELEAEYKWVKRKQRINYDNLIIKMNDRDLFDADMLPMFEKVPARKVFLSSRYVNHNFAFKLYGEKEGCIQNEWTNFRKTISPISLMNNLMKR
ncbi:MULTISPECIES: DUF1919 domain-containing protein [Vibrio]|uniref:DUF1919 domain-containing protein n=1 Tax=Vibrio TaxID=662 RepID=UPI0020C19286|nr:MULTISPECIES: DUF1919 domain-containing protein [Vibrio]MDW2326716.1 DUF1919 domain-containing protein [Vibrio sp. 1401]